MAKRRCNAGSDERARRRERDLLLRGGDQEALRALQVESLRRGKLRQWGRQVRGEGAARRVAGFEEEREILDMPVPGLVVARDVQDLDDRGRQRPHSYDVYHWQGLAAGSGLRKTLEEARAWARWLAPVADWTQDWTTLAQDPLTEARFKAARLAARERMERMDTRGRVAKVTPPPRSRARHVALIEAQLVPEFRGLPWPELRRNPPWSPEYLAAEERELRESGHGEAITGMILRRMVAPPQPGPRYSAEELEHHRRVGRQVVEAESLERGPWLTNPPDERLRRLAREAELYPHDPAAQDAYLAELVRAGELLSIPDWADLSRLGFHRTVDGRHWLGRHWTYWVTPGWPGFNVGLNADWSVMAWYISPELGPANRTPGGWYVLDDEEGPPGHYWLVQRSHSPDGYDQVTEHAHGLPPDLVNTYHLLTGKTLRHEPEVLLVCDDPFDGRTLILPERLTDAERAAELRRWAR